MKKLILAATLVAPLAGAPAFAGDAAGFIETPAATTALYHPREFAARMPAPGRPSAAERAMVQRGAVPSSAFTTAN